MFKKFIDNIYTIFAILLILVFVGFYLSKQLPVDIFPNLNYPLFNIITHYPGGSPKDMETLITRPIESQVGGLLNVRRVSSISKEGLSQVTVEFGWGTDVPTSRQLVQQAISKIQNDLPPGTAPVVENIGATLQNIMGYGVFTTQKDSLDLRYLIKTKIVNHLKSINGVSHIEIIGGDKEAYTVHPNPLLLLKYNLTAQDIKQSIEKNNFQVMAGYYEKFSKDYAIRGIGTMKNLTDLNTIVVRKENQTSIKLSDVAKITKGHLPKRYHVYIDGKPGLAFAIYKAQKANTVAISHKVEKTLSKLQKNLPAGITIKKYYDQAELINEATKAISSDIIIGGLLVLFILILFLGRYKDAFIIALNIPVIFFISFIFFYFAKLSMNMITLGALAVVLGMIVDDSIIVLENILRHRTLEKTPLKASIIGTKEIMGADISGTLTTVAAFIPFVFMTGLAGRFAIPFGIVMIITLSLSLILSLLVIPLWLGRDKQKPIPNPKGSKLLEKLVAFNHTILTVFLKNKKKVIILTTVIFILSAGLLVFSPVSFLPQVDEGAILLEYILPPGTSLKESNKVGKLLDSIILKNKNVYTIYRRTGSEAGTFQVEPVNRGEIVIKLLPIHKRKDSIFKIINELKKKTAIIPGMISMYHLVTAEKMDEGFSGLPTMFGVVIYGPDYKKLVGYANHLDNILNNTKGFGNVVNNTKYKVPELQILPKRTQLIRYGLSTKNIMETVRLYLGGEVTSQILDKEKIIPIFLIVNKKSLTTNIRQIENIPIKIGKNQYIPLKQVAMIKEYLGAGTITHINLQREITLPAEISGSLNKAVSRLKSKIQALHLEKGYSVDFDGQYKTLKKMIVQFAFFALISIVIVFLIMSVQFGNYIHPFVIMIEIPFSFIGAFLAIALSRQEMNLSFFIGLITLIGISVNNGIVLIDYINRMRAKGMNREDAIYEATKIRTRPIFLTAITSIFALFPISLGLGAGSKIHQSLAIALIGGLSVNTILTLNLLPVIYCVFEDTVKKIQKIKFEGQRKK